MTPKQFLTEFGHIASAPNGVQRLREMVLQLAVHGSLTEQDPNEGQASALMAFAAQRKREAIENKQFKTTSKLESLGLEIPREIVLPENWGWVRLSDLGEINPRNDCDNELDVSFLPMGVISQNHRGPLAPEKRKWSEIKKGFTHVADGDVILAKITPCFENGKSAVVCGLTNGFGAGTTEIHVFRAMPDVVDVGYVYVFLRSPHFAIVGEANMTGTAGQKRLPTEYFASRAMPLPPLAEQKRIVAKVDELMALCDNLETLQNQRKAARAILTKEILGRVASDTTVDAQTCLQNLSLLVSSVDQIPVLRQTILSLAVQGKLVPQDPGDEPVQRFLEKVSEARSAKNAKGYPAVSENEVPNNVPSHWVWSRLGNLALHSDSGWSPQCSGEPRTGDNWGVLKVSAVSWGSYDAEQNKALPSGMDGRPDAEVHPGDFLLSRANTEDLVARSVIVDQTPPRLMMSDKIVRFTFPEFVEKRFIQLANLSSFARAYYALNASGTSSSMKNVGREVMSRLPVPLPPLAEQKRIVAKVDELMALCDTLEAKLRKANQVQEQLAISSIAALTGIQSLEKDTMKAPKTELVARLKIGKKPTTKDQAPLAALLVRHNGELDPKVLWQHSSLEIDAFYHQLKFEMNQGWIVQPEVPAMRLVGER